MRPRVRVSQIFVCFVLVTYHRVLSVIPSEIFSPASGGSVKVSMVMEEMSAHGRMRLKP